MNRERETREIDEQIIYIPVQVLLVRCHRCRFLVEFKLGCKSGLMISVPSVENKLKVQSFSENTPSLSEFVNLIYS